MTFPIDSQVGSLMGKLAHVKSAEEEVKLRRKLSELNKVKTSIRHRYGSNKDLCEIENTYREISGLENKYG